MSLFVSAPSSFPSSFPLLPSIAVRDQGIHPLLKSVRSVYRAQQRKPQFEPVCVEWIERYARTYPTRFAGPLGEHHAEAFLSSLAERGESPERQAQAREALHFLYADVLRGV